jgi:uncharacterized PurR-regulated membrane protein YhhQ (DUF165 family)
VGLALIASQPRIALVGLAYTYTVGALVVWAYTRLRRRKDGTLHVEGHEVGDKV